MRLRAAPVPVPAIRRAGGRWRDRQWRGGLRDLGVNLALPLRGAGPPVHLDAKERDEMNMQRGL